MNDIRAGLVEVSDTQSSRQSFFVLMVLAVVVVGGVIGYLAFPEAADNDAPVNQMAPTPTQAEQAPILDDATRATRRLQMDRFRLTQTQLLKCARTQRQMATLYRDYSDRNLAAYQAWHRLYDPAQALAQMGDLSPVQQAAFMAAQRNQAVELAIEDIEQDVAAVQTDIDPIACGQLSAQVQRRALDLDPAPVL